MWVWPRERKQGDALRNRCSKCVFLGAVRAAGDKSMYPWQIQHIPFSCKQGKKGASQHLFSVPVFFLSSDSLRSPDVHCSAHLERERERAAAGAVGVTSSALHPWPKTDASKAFITAPAFCHVMKGLSLYALLILYTLSSEHIEYIVLLDNSEH